MYPKNKIFEFFFKKKAALYILFGRAGFLFWFVVEEISRFSLSWIFLFSCLLFNFAAGETHVGGPKKADQVTEG